MLCCVGYAVSVVLCCVVLCCVELCCVVVCVCVCVCVCTEINYVCQNHGVEPFVRTPLCTLNHFSLTAVKTFHVKTNLNQILR